VGFRKLTRVTLLRLVSLPFPAAVQLRETRYTSSVDFTFESQLPSWMTFISGGMPILFVAPHGGRRPPEAPILDSIKVNDLHTADLTATLAQLTGGYALINHERDRNELDLNRVSQVRKEAIWFLEALNELLVTLVAHHGEARVFFMHGWNVVQPVCDLGLGLKQRGNTVVPASKFAAPTLSAQFFTEAVLPFRDAAVIRGIDVAIGRRYPAADKNNVMQLFSKRFADDCSPVIQTLAQLSMDGKVNAVQCELGVGLRWPGPERDAFIEIFCQTLGQTQPQTQVSSLEFSSLTVPRRTHPTAHLNGAPLPLRLASEAVRLGLHFHDPTSGLGLLGGIECDPAESTHSGRLMMFLGGTEMVLFTGEDDSATDPSRVHVGGLTWQTQPTGFAISYRGTVMRFSHPQAFIRLEDGLAASWVEPAEMKLTLTLPVPLPSPPVPLYLAHLRGEVNLRDRRYVLDAWGFLDSLKPEETGRLMPRRLLSLPFGPDLGVFLYWVETLDGPRSAGVIYHHGEPHALQPEDWQLHYTLHEGRPRAFRVALTPPTPLTLHCDGETLTHIPIVRHAPQGNALDVTFGLSRALWQGREALGIYEFSERRKD